VIPDWLHWISIASLAGAGICVLIVAVDVARHPQQMWIMNIVWPVVASFGSVIALIGYFRWGRLARRRLAETARERGDELPSRVRTPFPVMVAKGAAHCGAGCTLGDIIAEWLALAVPAVAVWFGWRTLFGEKMFAVWILDYIFAFCFGIAFQYFTIKPMRELSPGRALIAALKADTLSLTAWQVGMYGFMAFAHFYLFGSLLGADLHVNAAPFWFMMQLAMMMGFLTAYPVNWWLIRVGIKETM
jgi:hypothetical protein